MRTFFLQMFLSFWVSIIGIFLVATALNPDAEHGSIENIFAFAQADATKVHALAVGAYERHGCEGFQHVGQEYLLADAHGEILCGDMISEKMTAVIRQAVEKQDVQGVHDGSMWVTATPYSTELAKYVVVHRGPYIRRPWFPHLPFVALPVSMVVTFLFAFLLTRPVRALSRAFREFSSGDLAVRLPVERRPWSGVGGADVRSLMLDFNSMADRVSSLIQAQKMLVRDVSHELRSPLARLRLALEMAREESPQPISSLDRMEIEAERVNELIGQMLTLSLMESTREISPKERIDIVELIESRLSDLQFEAAARGRSVTFQSASPSLFVEGNAELLRRTTENVVRNAIRFTAPGTEVSISIKADEVLEPAHKRRPAVTRPIVAIEISDHGPGVPEESLPLLFRAFYRTDNARRDSTGGFGVGLSIAERAVRLHGGTISAANRPEGGLVVSIRLPRLLD